MKPSFHTALRCVRVMMLREHVLPRPVQRRRLFSRALVEQAQKIIIRHRRFLRRSLGRLPRVSISRALVFFPRVLRPRPRRPSPRLHTPPTEPFALALSPSSSARLLAVVRARRPRPARAVMRLNLSRRSSPSRRAVPRPRSRATRPSARPLDARDVGAKDHTRARTSVSCAQTVRTCAQFGHSDTRPARPGTFGRPRLGFRARSRARPNPRSGSKGGPRRRHRRRRRATRRRTRAKPRSPWTQPCSMGSRRKTRRR